MFFKLECEGLGDLNKCAVIKDIVIESSPIYFVFKRQSGVIMIYLEFGKCVPPNISNLQHLMQKKRRGECYSME